MFALAATQTLSVPSLLVLAVIAVALLSSFVCAAAWYTTRAGCAYHYLMQQAAADYSTLVEHHEAAYHAARAAQHNAKRKYRMEYTFAGYAQDPFLHAGGRLGKLPPSVQQAFLEYSDAKDRSKRAKADYRAAVNGGVQNSGMILKAYTWPRSPELRAYLRDHDHKLLRDEPSVS